jgi:large subunit ribosomal protein L34
MSKERFNHRKKKEISTVHGQNGTQNGRKVLARRRAKGRHKLTVSCRQDTKIMFV